GARYGTGPSHARTRAMTDVRVPELARRPEPVEAASPLTESIEMLLAGEDKTQPEAAVLGIAGRRIDEHAGVGGLAKQPVAVPIEDSEAKGMGCDLDRQFRRDEADGLRVDQIARERRPLAADEVRLPPALTAPPILDSHDPRGEEGDRHLAGAARKREGAVAASLESGILA